MRVLDLFSGIGGFSLGLERAGMETVAFCERDEWCQKVLKKHWPDVPIYDDVRELDYDGSVDLICGGYPCQPFSVAGNRKGQEDDRHLWPAMFDLIKKHRPRWVIGENVAGHITMGLDDVLADLEGEGYETTTFVIPACAVDAPHRRDRVWIVTHTQSKRMEGHRTARIKESQAQVRADVSGRHSSGKRAEKWEAEPALDRVVDGVPSWVDRLRALGNAVVPKILEVIGRAIMEVEARYAH